MTASRIYMSSPDIGHLEEDHILAALRSGWIAPLGPDVDAFERELADRVGVAHGVALSSGTAALHLGLLALGVGPGDVVLTSTMTFAATANAIVYTGAEPYFIDAEPDTGNIDVALLERAIVRLQEDDERIGAIVPVDLLGKAVNYTEIERIAQQYGIPLLADAAESFGASHGGRAAGSFGRASIVSFNGNKVMTTSRWRHAADRRGRSRAARAVPRHPGPSARGALRAHRHRLQLPPQQPARRPAAPSCRASTR